MLAINCRLSLRLSSENLVQPAEQLCIEDTKLGKADVTGDGHRPDDSVYTQSPMDTSIEVPLDME